MDFQFIFRIGHKQLWTDPHKTNNKGILHPVVQVNNVIASENKDIS